MSAPAPLSRKIHFGSSRAIQPPQQPAGRGSETGRVPRVAQLLALAIRFEELVTDGVGHHADAADGESDLWRVVP